AAPEIKKTILLTSSENAKTLSTPAIVSLEELKTVENPELYRQRHLPVAILLEGNFSSLYANRMAATTKDVFAQAYGRFISKSEPNSMLVVGDGDWILNEYTRNEAFSMGYSRVLERSFSNRVFLQNCLQYMTGNPALVMLRNKEISLQLLNTEKVETEKRYWQSLNLALPILMIILAGLVYTRWRKHRYAKPRLRA
ncbi:MAG: Gldg family protein, partial [Chitinophagaceae bacterium]